MYTTLYNNRTPTVPLAVVVIVDTRGEKLILLWVCILNGSTLKYIFVHMFLLMCVFFFALLFPFFIFICSRTVCNYGEEKKNHSDLNISVLFIQYIRSLFNLIIIHSVMEKKSRKNLHNTKPHRKYCTHKVFLCACSRTMAVLPVFISYLCVWLCDCAWHCHRLAPGGRDCFTISCLAVIKNRNNKMCVCVLFILWFVVRQHFYTKLDLIWWSLLGRSRATRCSNTYTCACVQFIYTYTVCEILN